MEGRLGRGIATMPEPKIDSTDAQSPQIGVPTDSTGVLFPQTKQTIRLPSSAFSKDGYHDPVKNLLTFTPPMEGPRVVHDYRTETTVVIPIHNDPRRIETLEVALEGVRQNQSPSQPVRVVIADNGLTQEGIEKIRGWAVEKSLDLSFVDARPSSEKQKSPAYARNVALRHITNSAKEDPAFRGPVLLVDSDGAPLTGALSSLTETLRVHPDAAIVSAQIVSVNHLDEKSYKEQSEKERGGSVYRLPQLWTLDDKVDLGSIVAFSSLVAGKTNGSLLNFSTAIKLLEHSGDLYVQMPNKSAEDMIAATALNKHGKIYLDTRATVLDEARETPEQIREQQIKWGMDHVLLAECLQGADLLKQDGLHVLEPFADTWREWIIPGTEGINGYIVNPDELRKTSAKLSEKLNGHLLSEANTRIIVQGQRVVDVILDIIDHRRKKTQHIVQRTDLPKPIIPDSSNPRFSDETKTARLIGNIKGMDDIFGVNSLIRDQALPNVIMFGTRQSAAWK